MRASVNSGPSIGADALRRGAGLLWQAVRVPLLGILMLLEPVVRYFFGGAMILGILVSVIFECSAVGPKFPFLGMLTASLACGVILSLYYGIVGLLVR